MKIISVLLLGFVYLFSNDAFINPKELKEKLNNKNLVILDTTNEEEFNLGHIPNAVRIDASKLRHKKEKHQLINSPQKIEKVFQSLGVNKNSEVVIYGHNIENDILKSSYVALALIANGCENVSILNGGFSSWLNEYEFDDLISTQIITPKKGNFRTKFNSNILVDKDYVQERIGKVAMIEARPSEYYKGNKYSPGVKRLGHIPKAKSSYWGDKFNNEHKLKRKNDISALFINDNKLNKDQEVIAYCTGGLEASMNWYLLARHLEFKDVKIYDASMRQWGNLSNTPLEK